MIEFALKVLLIASFILICLEDVKYRMVYALNYVFCGVTGFLLHVRMVGLLPALASSAVNVLFAAIVVTVAFAYSRLVMKKAFVNVSIGSGDLVFFGFLTLGLPTVTYITLFIFSLVFALILNFASELRKPQRDVPLAGYMAIFYAVIYTVSFFVEPKYLFSL